MKHSMAFLLLAGCCAADPAPADPGPTADLELQQIRGALSGPRTLRVKFKGEWPNAVGQMPRNVAGTVLLGDGDRARISMSVATAFGKTKSYEAVCDGKRLWRSPSVEALRFNPAPTALRFELLYALSCHGLGWSFPHGTHPNTIGEGYVVLDMVPKRNARPSHLERAGALDHPCPEVDYRMRLTFDPASNLLRKRELIGDLDRVWYVESYEVEQNAGLADGEFKLPEK